MVSCSFHNCSPIIVDCRIHHLEAVIKVKDSNIEGLKVKADWCYDEGHLYKVCDHCLGIRAGCTWLHSRPALNLVHDLKSAWLSF